MTASTRRRQVIQTIGSIGVVGVAGCLGDDSADDAGADGASVAPDDDNGDTDDAPAQEPDIGMVYAFAPNSISVIDPDTGDILTEITDGLNDESWGDPQITNDYGKIFINRQSPSQVLVLDTSTHELIDEVDIGPGPVHIYHPSDEEIWSHADDEGALYVIDADTHEVSHVVESGLDGEGHGKLLYHEDFDETGYATNVNDPGLPVIDLDGYERTDFIEFGEEGGTHYKAYGPQNGLIYGEFGDVTPAVDAETHDLVDELAFSGGMYLTPDEQLMGVLDGDTIRFVDVTDRDHDIVDTVEVEGGPDALRYHDAENGATYAVTANTRSDQASVIDLDTFEVVNQIEVGHIFRPEGAPFLHRSGVAADGLFVTPAAEDGFVALVDMGRQELIDHIDVDEGVDTVQIVGDSGTGYTGNVR